MQIYGFLVKEQNFGAELSAGGRLPSRLPLSGDGLPDFARQFAERLDGRAQVFYSSNYQRELIIALFENKF